MHRPPTSPPPSASLVTDLQVETPEHVTLRYELAGVGSRLTAALMDHLILVIWAIACLVIATWTDFTGRWGLLLWTVVAIISWMGYFTLFEAYRGGQTPGKRQMGIRVVRDTGHGLTFGAAFTRNVMRAADFVPPPYLSGLLFVMLHPRSQRLGDLVAGTIVVRDRPIAAPAPVAAPATIAAAPQAALAGPPLDDATFRLLTAWHARVDELEPETAERVTDQLAARLAPSYPVRPAEPRAFLLQLHRTEQERRAGPGAAARGTDLTTASKLLGRHAARWGEFQLLADRAAARGLDDLSAAELPDFAARYREVAADLARARTYRADPATQARLERLAAAGHNLLYRDERRTARRIAEVILRECPAAVWRARRAVLLALVCFFGPAAASYQLIREEPALAYDVLPDVMLDRAEEGHARRADGLGYVELDEEDRPFMAVRLIQNNVSVAFRCFAGGIFLGVGSLFLLAYNGIHLGTSAGHYANVGLLDYLMTFIVGHGVLELFAIAVAGAAGFLLGLALIAPGDLTRREALVVQGRTAIRMVGMVVVLLIVAGLIEGLASASGASVTYRVAVSSASAVFLLLYLANGARWASTLDGP